MEKETKAVFAPIIPDCIRTVTTIFTNESTAGADASVEASYIELYS